jgi:antitoxin HicB
MSQSQEYRPVFRRLSEDEGGGWLVEFPDLPGCMADGETLDEALAQGRDAAAAWLDTAKADGREIPSPSADEAAYSGKWVQRVPKSLHARLTERARDEGVSLNTLVTTFLSDALARREERSADPRAASDTASTASLSPREVRRAGRTG